MTLEQKIDELLTAVKDLNTRVMFIQDDMEELKETVNSIGETVVTIAMQNSLATSQPAPEPGNKQARMEAFRKEASRW